VSSTLPSHAGTAPVTESDEAIESALASANVLCLVASVVHITGDASILRGNIRPRIFGLSGFDGGLSPEDQAELRRAALPAVIAYRDSGSATPPPLPEPVLRELIDWVAGENVSDDYAGMLLEEMDLEGADPRRISIPSTNGVSAIIIGAGMSGLLAAVRLKQAGIPFEIIEKNDEVGGTWFENTYPGCRVDIGNHLYCYSFEPNHGFSEYFSRQPELLDYFRDVAQRHGLEEHIRWRTEVERAQWDDDAQVWRVITTDSEGRRGESQATAVISGVGQLNRPYIPDLPNLQRFAGPVFHSAVWDHSIDLRGKRVALIGAGASGFQIGPAIADHVEHLTVFQRSAQWIMPNPIYHRAVDARSLWAMRHLPGYARWYRFLLLWQATDKPLEVARVDPNWEGLPLSANRRSQKFREMVVRWMQEQVGDDADLLSDVVPDYPPMGKRMLQDDGSWLRCLARDDVDLVRDRIDDIEEHAVVAGGRRYEADVLVLATGFRANEFLFPMQIVGRKGESLVEFWGGRPSAYLGITVPGFPNLFLMYGPGTNLAHAGSIIFHAECQMRYIGASLAILAANRGGAIEPTQEAYEDYVQRLQRELSTMVWSHPSVAHSWYKAGDGHVYVLSPWRLVDYWQWTAAPDPNAHKVTAPREAR
jgi:4-hydroxyacetophenone monooxygenase